jgi:GWxTD domain-containing protein
LPPPPAPASPAAKAEVKLLAQAQQAPPAARGQEAETHKLNDDLALPARYRQWLEMEVTYIITDQERAVFRSLRTDEERDQFIEQFWLRRDPTPATVENEYKEEHYRRISYSSERFRAANIPGWKTDRGRTYILYGSPDEIESHPSGGPTTYPFEQWLYRHLDGGGDNVVIEFVNRAGAGEFRRASSPLEKYTLTANPEAAPDVRVGRSGVIVEAPNGTALISIPLRSYGDRVNVFGRIMDDHSRVVHFFDDNVRLSRSPAHEGVVVSLYSKSLALPAGSYRLTVVVKDLTTGVSTDEDMSFDVH